MEQSGLFSSHSGTCIQLYCRRQDNCSYVPMIFKNVIMFWETMNKKRILIFAIGLVLITALVFGALPVSAQPRAGQIQYQTPTPGTDGRIIYTVKAGDNCTGIAILNGITTEELIAKNSLAGDGCQFLQEGQKLLIHSRHHRTHHYHYPHSVRSHAHSVFRISENLHFTVPGCQWQWDGRDN